MADPITPETRKLINKFMSKSQELQDAQAKLIQDLTEENETLQRELAIATAELEKRHV